MLPLVAISDLPNRPHSVRMHVRIVRVWAAKGPYNPGIWYYGALLLDTAGNVIEARIPREHYQRVSRLLEEGRLCEIARFSIKTAPIQYHIVEGSHILAFNRQTTVTPLLSSSLQIPMRYFQFKRLDSVGTEIKSTDKIIDVVGRIAGFSPIRDENEVDQRKPAQIMYLADERGYMLEVTLWRQFLSIFNTAELHEQSKIAPVIVICAAVQVNEWEGVYNVKAFSATKFYFDRDIPEIAQFAASLPPNLPSIVLNTHGPPYDGVPVINTIEQENQPEPQIMKISEFLAIPVDIYSNTLYKCVATIADLDNRYEWWHQACKKCMSKLKDEYCYRCSAHRDNFMNWYKLDLKVQDETGHALFTALGNIAKIIIGADVDAMVKELERTKDDAPQKVLAIIGKAYLFTVLAKESTKFPGVRMNRVVRIDAVPATNTSLLAIDNAAKAGTSLPHTSQHQSYTENVPDEAILNPANQPDQHSAEFPPPTPPPTMQASPPLSSNKPASTYEKGKNPITQSEHHSEHSATRKRLFPDTDAVSTESPSNEDHPIQQAVPSAEAAALPKKIKKEDDLHERKFSNLP